MHNTTLHHGVKIEKYCEKRKGVVFLHRDEPILLPDEIAAEFELQLGFRVAGHFGLWDKARLPAGLVDKLREFGFKFLDLGNYIALAMPLKRMGDIDGAVA